METKAFFAAELHAVSQKSAKFTAISGVGSTSCCWTVELSRSS
ncbi:hypothetical protein CASFOL_039502 [Castilleja foliolosa]